MPFLGKYTFTKEERLKSTGLIRHLFTTGNMYESYPFKAYWDHHNDTCQQYPVKTGFSVPSKHFKRAADRNLIKRRMREAYRNNKYIIFDCLNGKNTRIILMVLYLPKKKIAYHELQEGIKRLLNGLCNNISAKND